MTLLFNCYQTKDGRLVAYSELQAQLLDKAVEDCKVLGHELDPSGRCKRCLLKVRG